MSDAEEQRDKGTEGQGPNLVLAYGLIALGLLIAAGFAVMVVLPFYHRR